jgi:DNA-binding NtrC family response regulator
VINGNTFITNVDVTSRPSVNARVLIVEGPDAPKEMALPPAGLTFGTAKDCAVRLTDQRVSRQHLHILGDGASFRVRDLGSSNGTFIGGVRTNDGLAPVGTLVRIGRTTLRLVGEARYETVPRSSRRSFGGLLGKGPAMRQIFGVLERVAASDTSVLIEGETGTGKELVARALHTEGPRAAGPFVAIDCGAITPSLIESVLFGHERGAFTSAHETRTGAFERAHKGTLFLDEIGELPIDLQPKLLRVLETREVCKVGGSSARRVDLRVVAASNRDLARMVAAGTFRADLYYRLAVVHVVVPPLRERLEDLPLLIEHFLQEAGASSPERIAGPNLELLSGHTWPGNVRELRNVLHRALAYAGAPPVRFSELPIQIGTVEQAEADGGDEPDVDQPFLAAKEELVDGFERAYLKALLAATNDNVAEAARRARLNRRYLYDLLKKHGLRR